MSGGGFVFVKRAPAPPLDGVVESGDATDWRTRRTERKRNSMATAFEVGARIDRSPAEVWAVLTDWERAPEWMDGIESMGSDGGLAEGAQLTFVARGKERTSVIAALDPESSLTLRSTQGGVVADYRYDLTADGDGTAMKLTADCSTSGVWVVFGPLLRRLVRRADSGQLEALKTVVEDG